uniref:Uncharacterized protein n=1 Tax=Romanomermis culicivorax TaxID=13658 RepID=A0A915JNC6_ROMCU
MTFSHLWAFAVVGPFTIMGSQARKAHKHENPGGFVSGKGSQLHENVISVCSHMRQFQLPYPICALANCADFQVGHFYMRPMHLSNVYPNCNCAFCKCPAFVFSFIIERQWMHGLKSNSLAAPLAVAQCKGNRGEMMDSQTPPHTRVDQEAVEANKARTRARMEVIPVANKAIGDTIEEGLEEAIDAAGSSMLLAN